MSEQEKQTSFKSENGWVIEIEHPEILPEVHIGQRSYGTAKFLERQGWVSLGIYDTYNDGPDGTWRFVMYVPRDFIEDA